MMGMVRIALTDDELRLHPPHLISQVKRFLNQHTKLPLTPWINFEMVVADGEACAIVSDQQPDSARHKAVE